MTRASPLVVVALEASAAPTSPALVLADGVGEAPRLRVLEDEL